MRTPKQLVLLIVSALMIAPGLSLAAIEEGLLLDGVEGVVRKVKEVDVWQFVPDEKVTVTEEVTLDAHKSLSLLPCSVLEQITELAAGNTEIPVRLWAMFTQYENNNYLYCVYFLPTKNTPAKPAEQETVNTEDTQPKAVKAEDDSIIPADILKQIKETKTPDLKMFQQLAKVTGDVNLINRDGYLKQTGKIKYFQPDAFGRNINRNQYRLLPCDMLSAAERKMQQTPGRQRYNVSGLVTVYKGRQYMLIRRAARTYTNGNFTP